MSTHQQQPRNWFYWVIMGLGIILIFNLSRGAWFLYNVRGRMQTASARVAKLQQEKVALEQESQHQLSQGFAEREIRDKLNMAKPGEVVVILPEMTPAATPTASLQPKELVENLPNWKKWLEVFGFTK